MSQYAALDAAILGRLSQSAARFYLLEVNPEIVAEAQRLSDLTGRERFRIIDGRLISLRKAGKIKPGRVEGWSLVTTAKEAK